MSQESAQISAVTSGESNGSMDKSFGHHLDDDDQLTSRDSGDPVASLIDQDADSRIKFKDWGFQVDRLFEVAYRFYKRNESKAFHPSFDERNQLIALILQARYGNFDDSRASDVGTLDLVGRSRRQQWALLKNMSKTEAKSKFVCSLDEICPFFKAYAEAVKISCSNRPSSDDAKASSETSSLNESHKEDEKLKTIYTSLCRQTHEQFKGYAMKQYPDDVQQQKYLISSLQEQYYQQYISQMHPDISNNSHKVDLKCSLSPTLSESSSVLNESDNLKQIHLHDITDSQEKQTSDAISSIESPPITSTLESNGNHSREGDVNQNGLNKFKELATEVSVVEPKLTDESKRPEIKVEDRKEAQQTPKQESDLPRPNPYRLANIRSIAKFESFPEPRPIPNNLNQSYTSIHPRNSETNDIRYEKPRQAHTILHIEESPPKINEVPTSILPAPPLQELPPVSHGDHDLPDISNDPINTNHSPNAYIDNYRVAVGSHDMASTVAEKLPVELWDGDSSSEGSCSPLEQSTNHDPLEPATIWTKKGVNEFKESLVDDNHSGMYVVKQGTLVTIQVPTYPNGKYIHWEFATEDFDIGFGLDFVYETNLEKPLSIKIVEETDEEEEDDDYEFDREKQTENDIDRGDNVRLSALNENKVARFSKLAQTISIIPTYRRDSHEEVFVGRHKYPGQGYYLLKFDNTYSVLRSKSLYFRICYFI